MHIYFSGIGGVGIGPLAEIAHDAGYMVTGSDREASPVTRRLDARGIPIHIGQTTEAIEEIHTRTPIDRFIYTAALPPDHPELAFAKRHGISCGKRDELLAQIITEKELHLIAVSGTHGKTTTTGMLIWAFQYLRIPISYSVGTTLSYGPSGKYDAQSQYFVYECDEYDRNMLHFEPQLALITALDYDHPDTYENEHVYKDAFVQFMRQSTATLLWEKDLRYLSQPDIAASYEAYDDLMNLSRFTLPGNHVRHNAFLVYQALGKVAPSVPTETILAALNTFPGTDRRFEKLSENLYSDYGHHPAEIAATLQLTRELSDEVVLVYQPHQNIRQHEIKDQYSDSMVLAQQIYWLPTYLSREDPSLEVLTPEQLSATLTNVHAVKPAEMNEDLWKNIQHARQEGKLVLVMGAGSIDNWVRKQLAERS